MYMPIAYICALEGKNARRETLFFCGAFFFPGRLRASVGHIIYLVLSFYPYFSVFFKNHPIKAMLGGAFFGGK